MVINRQLPPEDISLSLSQKAEFLHMPFVRRLAAFYRSYCVLPCLGIYMDHEIIAQIGKEQIISAARQVSVHKGATSVFVTIFIAFHPHYINIPLVHKVIVISRAFRKYHVQAL